jgi:hypothetical protein
MTKTRCLQAAAVLLLAGTVKGAAMAAVSGGFAGAGAHAAHAVAPALWGADGHRMIARLAVARLPEEMPAFFREAADQLAYLNPEPDRWRERRERQLEPAMDAAHSPEHFIDLEMLPANALAAPDRLAYADSLRAHGVDTGTAGLLPYRMLELSQRLRVAFGQWRAVTDPAERAWIEARIINDAGILGHYVADGSNPHHTTIHYNGWVGDNPRGFTTGAGFHGRFESLFVQRHITQEMLGATPLRAARALPDLRAGIWSYIDTTHSHLIRLYELDLQEAFGADTRSPEHRHFAIDRLAAGAHMLRDLWWSAWVSSERT